MAFKDEETGIVAQDTSKCIGCQSCIKHCPYEGVRTYLDEEPVYAIDMSLGFPEEPPHLKNSVEKCTFCYERVKNGQEPACIRLCIGRKVLGRYRRPRKRQLEAPDISRVRANRHEDKLAQWSTI